MKVLGIQALVAVVFMGLLSGTASAASRDVSSKALRANAQTQFQSEHQSRVSALYQNNTN